MRSTNHDELELIDAEVRAAESEVDAAKSRAEAARLPAEKSQSRIEVFVVRVPDLIDEDGEPGKPIDALLSSW